MKRSVYFISKVTREKVFVCDADTGVLSVTNDAEAVCKELFVMFGQRRFIYRDSEMNWDELGHVAGVFTDFLRYTEELP